MPSNAVIGVGTSFQRGNGASSEAFTPIAEIRSIDFAGLVREFFEVTTLDSVDGYREFKSGFRDGGTVTLVMNFTAATWIAFKADFDNDDQVNYRLVASDTAETQLDFAAFCTGIPITFVPDDAVISNVTIKVTGPIFLTT
jgi:hypothetical protein